MTDKSPPAATGPLAGLPLWSIGLPPLALVLALLVHPGSTLMTVVLAMVLVGTILAAVVHAETLAHYLGEPFGTLVLAFAVTVIECSLIVSIMLSEGNSAQALARDTLMAAIMITINGIVGLCLLAGGHRHFEQTFTRSGTSIGLAMLSTLAVLTLVMPNFTTSARGPYYTSSQLAFVAVIALVLYATFVVAQTIRHRDHFISREEQLHAQETKTVRGQAVAAGALMIPALAAVVLLAKALSGTIEQAVAAIGAPAAVVGIVIALLVLAPEGLAALRAAQLNRVQTSLNLAIGSALATIGLTIPAVAIIALVMGLDLQLGLKTSHMVLLALTLLVASFTLSTGRTNMVQGVLHLVIFATYLFISLVP